LVAIRKVETSGNLNTLHGPQWPPVCLN
jgi:hypothetical protein